MASAGAIDKVRHCVFCGRPPESKNREHVLPQWLLELTGDPRRTVVMSFNPKTGEPIRFAWSALVMPACEACNLKYARLEEVAKPIVLELLARRPITSTQATLLMDWLDKVRIGLWLNQLALQKTGAVDPHLHVDNRIGAKDRLLYVYTLEGQGSGLNGLGIDNLVFQHQPSCFALRINDLILFNASADYAFSERCGFWHPGRIELILDGANEGQVALGGFGMTRKVIHPIVGDFPLLKAPLRLIQPIAQRGADGEFFGPLRQNDSFHIGHMLDPGRGLGVIFRQFDDRVQPIFDPELPLDFETVDYGNGSAGDIVAQVYRYQTHLWGRGEFRGSARAVEHAKSMFSILAKTNEMRAVLTETGKVSDDGRDLATLAFRDAMEAARRPKGDAE